MLMPEMRMGFNPCFNGSWSVRAKLLLAIKKWSSFNPCFNGSWSVSCFALPVPLKTGKFQSLF